jgi:hypothetical protein
MTQRHIVTIEPIAQITKGALRVINFLRELHRK